MKSGHRVTICFECAFMKVELQGAGNRAMAAERRWAGENLHDQIMLGNHLAKGRLRDALATIRDEKVDREYLCTHVNAQTPNYVTGKPSFAHCQERNGGRCTDYEEKRI